MSEGDNSFDGQGLSPAVAALMKAAANQQQQPAPVHVPVETPKKRKRRNNKKGKSNASEESHGSASAPGGTGAGSRGKGKRHRTPHKPRSGTGSDATGLDAGTVKRSSAETNLRTLRLMDKQVGVDGGRPGIVLD